jgi:aryl-alcohol dehydrogenase-like predicted oxidoreductase
LSGKYNQGVPQGSRLTQPGYEWLRDEVLGKGGDRVEKVKQLPTIAAELGATPAQLAIAWCLTNPHVSTVLLGASRKEQLEQNLGALDLLPRLDAALKERIERTLA